ncbi:MAG: transketolase [Nitrospinae bacterium]|nr:transketolase [Nitrospinota bacterium]
MKKTAEELKQLANTARREILIMLNKAGSGHPGGSLSSIDILITLYFSEMKVDASNPSWSDRDRFVLSKGHCAPALYTVLAMKGFFGMEELPTLRAFGAILRGHPISYATPGVEVCTGSLGQGLSQANGIALGLNLDKKENTRVYAVVGDGECQEGMIWEAAMTASHRNLDNLCLFIDQNGLQIDGFVKDVKRVDPLVEKWKSFGWHTIEINGHSFDEILSALDEARSTKGKPTAIIANTVKGKGVSFMENKASWHGVAPNNEELERALAELAA